MKNSAATAADCMGIDQFDESFQEFARRCDGTALYL
jgi:hypothetical protein